MFSLFKDLHTSKVFHLFSRSLLDVLNSADTNINTLLVTYGHSVVFCFLTLGAIDPSFLSYCSFVSF